MTVYELLITFVVVWWLVFFMALPFGAQPEEAPLKGHAESAPAKPRILLKALITTVLAVAITWAISLVIVSGWIEIRPPRPPA